jgi:hypothetical protein
MNREDLPRPLRPFVRDDGRLMQWPTRQKIQRMAAALMASRFSPDRGYTEKEVNAVLTDGHVFADSALLRRLLCDWGYLDRERDGSRYWVRVEAANQIAEQLGPPPGT